MDSSAAPQLGRRASYTNGTTGIASDSNGTATAAASSSTTDSSSSSHTNPSKTETNWLDVTEPTIKSTDMPDVMQTHAIQSTQKAIEIWKEEGSKKSDFHNALARHVKKEFDATYGGVWHAIVGKNFGSFVVHQSRTFIYFYINAVAVLLFRSGSQAL